MWAIFGSCGRTPALLRYFGELRRFHRVTITLFGSKTRRRSPQKVWLIWTKRCFYAFFGVRNGEGNHVTGGYPLFGALARHWKPSDARCFALRSSDVFFAWAARLEQVDIPARRTRDCCCVARKGSGVWGKRCERHGRVDGTGVHRYAQDDGKNRQPQRQATAKAKTDNGGLARARCPS